MTDSGDRRRVLCSVRVGKRPNLKIRDLYENLLGFNLLI